MFGFSFSELVVVAIVALVVMGPKDLPKVLRRLGQLAGKIRRAAADLRAQSGIDDAIRAEGLSDDLAEIRKLARGDLERAMLAARIDSTVSAGDSSLKPTTEASVPAGETFVVRTREYPQDGADAYGALPEDALVYADSLPKSPFASDPLYATGDESTAPSS